jgi:hypothetical protein
MPLANTVLPAPRSPASQVLAERPPQVFGLFDVLTDEFE